MVSVSTAKEKKIENVFTPKNGHFSLKSGGTDTLFLVYDS